MPLVTLPVTAPLEEMLAVFRRDGGLIISDFLDAKDIEEFNKAAAPMFMKLQEAPKGQNLLSELGPNFHASHTTHLRGMLGKLPKESTKVLQHPVWNSLMHETLKTRQQAWIGENLIVTDTTHILSLGAAFHVAPGAENQVLHRDQTLHNINAHEGSLYTTDVGCLIAGTRATAKNGATRVIPGSHVWSPDRKPKPEEAIPAEMEPGSALFWFGSTYHGAGANLSEEGDEEKIRILYGFFGTQDFLRAEECQQLVCPPEVAKTLPIDVLRRAGWAKGRGGSGFVEAQDPLLSLGLSNEMVV